MAHAQTLQIVDNMTYNLTMGDDLEIYSNTNNNNYYNHFVQIVPPANGHLCFYGSPLIPNRNFSCHITDGVHDGIVYQNYSELDTGFVVEYFDGPILLWFDSRSLNQYTGFHIRACNTNVLLFAAADNITTTSARIYWFDHTEGASQWTIVYGRTPLTLFDTVVSTDDMITISDLEPDTRYCYRIYNDVDSAAPENDYCTSPLRFIKTTCDDDIYDFSNLRSCHIRTTTGPVADPYAYEELVCRGPKSSKSRHTKHTDTAEMDSATLGLMHTVCPGHSYSLRVGNTSVHAQAESIGYLYHVDTSRADMMLVNTALVLQDPGHTQLNQPHFKITVLDEDDEEINPTCYTTNYYAGMTAFPGQHWDSVYNPIYRDTIIFRDWSVQALDFSSLHGRDIKITFTSYDCAEGAHFGYGYFCVEEGYSRIKSLHCGDNSSQTFTAPPGFSYSWRRVGGNGTVLSTEQSITVSTPGVYVCTMSYIGGSGAICNVVMNATHGPRFPVADFSYTVKPNTCRPTLRFHNHGQISSSPTEVIPYSSERCDSVWWDFGDGTQSNEFSPTHSYDTAGIYQVTMVVYIGEGECTDTMQQQIVVESPCQQFDTIRRNICQGDSVLFHNRAIYESGVYEYDRMYTHYVLILQVFRDTDVYVYDTINERQLPYQAMGRTFNESVCDYLQHNTLDGGCDSLVHFFLTVMRDSTIHIDTTVCVDQLPLEWHGFTFASAGSQSVETVGRYGERIIYLMTVRVTDYSYEDIYATIFPGQDYLMGDTILTTSGTYPFVFANSGGCDSIVLLHLSLEETPLWIPNAFTPDESSNNLFRAYGNDIASLTITLFDRFGTEIAMLEGEGATWDGTYQGRPLPQAAYTYLAVWTTHAKPRQSKQLIGTVLLLR